MKMAVVMHAGSRIVHRPETGLVARPGHLFRGTANQFSWCGKQIDDPDAPYIALRLDPATTTEILCKSCWRVMP